MTVLSLEQLIGSATEDDLIAPALGILQAAGFPATSWLSGSVPRGLTKIDANVNTTLYSAITNIAKGGLLDLAAGVWLTLYAQSQYQTDRNLATFTNGKATLTAAPGAGPYTIAVNQLWATTADAKRFNNTTGGTLASGGSLQLEWKAEAAGASYNVANGAFLPTLVTSLPGVTVANPALVSGTWITSSGNDEETDANLRSRCRTKWATLGSGTSDAYVSWAKASLSTITRVKVDDQNPDGAGSLRVYLANASGAGTPTEVTTADAYIQARRPLTTRVTTLATTNKPISVTGTAKAKAAQLAAAQAAVTSNFTALQGSADIGGIVYLSELIEQIMTPLGVVDVALTAPLTNTVLALFEVPTFTLGLTWVAV